MKFEIKKETKKALQLEDENKVLFWVQRRWYRKNGTLTPAGLASYEKTPKTDEEIFESKYIELPASWEGEKSFGVDFQAEFVASSSIMRYNKLNPERVRLFFPKSVLVNGRTPNWIIQNKSLEYSERNKGWEILGLFESFNKH